MCNIDNTTQETAQQNNAETPEKIVSEKEQSSKSKKSFLEKFLDLMDLNLSDEELEYSDLKDDEDLAEDDNFEENKSNNTKLAWFTFLVLIFLFIFCVMQTHAVKEELAYIRMQTGNELEQIHFTKEEIEEIQYTLSILQDDLLDLKLNIFESDSNNYYFNDINYNDGMTLEEIEIHCEDYLILTVSEEIERVSKKINTRYDTLENLEIAYAAEENKERKEFISELIKTVENDIDSLIDEHLEYLSILSEVYLSIYENQEDLDSDNYQDFQDFLLIPEKNI